ncbi:MAG: methyltransferase domain-containing protein, partial [Bryobacteraceae bacterium]
MSWSAAQYIKFERERTQPVRDLLARVPEISVAQAADLGCGPGNSTEVLRSHFPEAAIIALDSSADMLAAARERLPEVHFELGDIAAWRSNGAFDVILVNAVLQWLPSHETLLPNLIARLAPGGCLAVQMPDNLDEPVHRAMREVADAGPWAAKLARASTARETRHSADWYYRVLRSCAASIDIWRTTYYHPLTGASSITEWFKATGLRPYLDPL